MVINTNRKHLKCARCFLLVFAYYKAEAVKTVMQQKKRSVSGFAEKNKIG